VIADGKPVGKSADNGDQKEGRRHRRQHPMLAQTIARRERWLRRCLLRPLALFAVPGRPILLGTRRRPLLPRGASLCRSGVQYDDLGSAPSVSATRSEGLGSSSRAEVERAESGCDPNATAIRLAAADGTLTLIIREAATV